MVGAARVLPVLSAYQQLGKRVRRRLLWTFIAFGIGAASTWNYREAVYNWLLVPGGGNLSPYDGLPVFTAPVDMMTVTIGLAMKGGMVAAVPVLTVGMFTLVRPVLPPPRRRFLAIFLLSLGLCFVGGAAFAYYVMLPTGMRFLLHFGDGVAVPLITFPQYLSMLFAMMFWLGITFELPLAMFLLAKMGIVSHRRMKGARKYVPVAAFFLSMILTPGADPISSVMVAVPLILLYEVGLFLSFLAHPDGEDYLAVRKLWRAAGWVLTRPLAVWRAVAAVPARVWRRLRG